MGYQYFALLDIRDFGVPTQVSDAQEIALRGRVMTQHFLHRSGR